MLGARRVAARWVILVAALVSAVLIGLGVLLVLTTHQLRTELRQAGALGTAEQTTSRLLTDVVDEEAGLRGYLLTADAAFLATYTAAQVSVPARLSRLRQLVAGIPGAGAALSGVASRHAAWLAFARTQIDRVQAGQLDLAIAVLRTGADRQRFDVVKAGVADLSAVVRGAAASNVAVAQALQRRLVTLAVLTLGVLAAVLASGLAAGTRWLLFGLVRPVQDLATAARAVADGDLSAPIPTGGVPEVAAMAEDMRAMRDRLLADRSHVAAAMRGVEQHGPAVTALREALSTEVGDVPGLAVAARLEAAEGLLAGDWYDVVAVCADRSALVLGDVAGHGPVSAVLALRLKHTLAAALRAGATPCEALAVTSWALRDIPPELFATVLVAEVDLAADRLVYANAGHPASLLVSPMSRIAAGHAVLPVSGGVVGVAGGDGAGLMWQELPATGPLLSPVVAGRSWGQVERRFRSGDALVAFTDGLLEARDAQGRHFGVDGVVGAIATTGIGDGPRLLDGLAAAAARHSAGVRRHDDQTLLYARRTPAGPAAAPGAAGTSRSTAPARGQRRAYRSRTATNVT